MTVPASTRKATPVRAGMRISRERSSSGMDFLRSTDVSAASRLTRDLALARDPFAAAPRLDDGAAEPPALVRSPTGGARQVHGTDGRRPGGIDDGEVGVL